MPQYQSLIKQLKTMKNVTAGCPCCGGEFKVASATLFDPATELPDEAQEAVASKQTLLNEEAQRIEEVKRKLEHQKHQATEGAKEKATVVNIGKIAEKVVTAWDGFDHHPLDCTALFDPVDYIAFDGLVSSERMEQVSFIEIKTGSSRLTKGQKLIKDAVEDGRVEIEQI